MLDSFDRASDDLAVHMHALETAPATSPSATTASPGKAACHRRGSAGHITAHLSCGTRVLQLPVGRAGASQVRRRNAPPFRRGSVVGFSRSVEATCSSLDSPDRAARHCRSRTPPQLLLSPLNSHALHTHAALRWPPWEFVDPASASRALRKRRVGCSESRTGSIVPDTSPVRERHRASALRHRELVWVAPAREEGEVAT